MANKITQKDYYNAIITFLNGDVDKCSVSIDAMIDFCEDRIEKLGRKATSKKPTKTQIANEGLKELLLTILTELDSAVTVSAIMTDPRIEPTVSSQKITPLLKQLEKDGLVTNFKEKGKSLYCVAGGASADSEDIED